jgi:hypothetical protein
MTATNWIQALSAVAVAVLTFLLWRITKRYTAANERMAGALERDLRGRYRPFVDVSDDVVWRDRWKYSVETWLSNKGLSPLRISRIAVTCGTNVLYQEQDVILAVGETRQRSVPFSLHDIAFQKFTEGQKVELEFTIEYTDPEEGAKKITRRPWLEYREQQSR